MQRHIVWLVAGVVLAATLGAAPAPQPTVPPAPQGMQQVQLDATRVAGSMWEKVEAMAGVAAGLVRPESKMVWITAVNVPGQRNWVNAGFRLAPLSTGAAMTGASAKAQFDVQGVGGRVICKINVTETRTGAQVVHEETAVSARGSRTVTTPVFTLQAGRQYRITAQVMVDPSNPTEPGAYAAVRISEIRWQLQ